MSFCVKNESYISKKQVKSIINGICDGIDSYYSYCKSKELNVKIRKLMKKLTFLSTKVRILTDIRFHGKQNIQKQDKKNFRKKVEEYIKDKQIGNFVKLMNIIQNEIRIKNIAGPTRNRVIYCM